MLQWGSWGMLFELRHGDPDRLQLVLFDNHRDGLDASPTGHDLVIVGSSSAGAAFWIEDLETAGVACNGYVPWLAGPSIDAIALHTRSEILTVRPPDVVVVGLTMRELNGASPTSAAQIGLLATWLGEETEGRAGLAGAKDWLFNNVALFRSRQILANPAQFGRAMLGRVGDELNADGNQLEFRGQLIVDEPPGHLRQEVFEMADYKLGEDQVDSLAAFLADIEAAGSTPVLVNVAVSDAFIALAPGGRQDYDQHFSAVSEVAAAADVDFADVNHMNAGGSAAATRMLAGILGPSSRTSCP
jgi:hypothetical protein